MSKEQRRDLITERFAALNAAKVSEAETTSMVEIIDLGFAILPEGLSLLSQED